MKFLVTGVNVQLGHDVMNELNKRGHEGVGSDIAPAYAGVADGSAVTTMPYVGLDYGQGSCAEGHYSAGRDHPLCSVDSCWHGRG